MHCFGARPQNTAPGLIREYPSRSRMNDAPPARVAFGRPDRAIIRPPGSGAGIGEHLAVNRFNPSDLVIGQRGKFLFLAAVGKSTAILVQEPEQKVRQPLRHIDHQVQFPAKCVVALQERGLSRQVAFDGLLHASIQKFGVRRRIEEPVEIVRIVQHPNVAAIRRLPVHDRQQSP